MQEEAAARNRIWSAMSVVISVQVGCVMARGFQSKSLRMGMARVSSSEVCNGMCHSVSVIQPKFSICIGAGLDLRKRELPFRTGSPSKMSSFAAHGWRLLCIAFGVFISAGSSTGSVGCHFCFFCVVDLAIHDSDIPWKT